MTLLGVPALWPVVVLVLLLATPISLARSACPKSCSCPSPREVHCTFRHLKSAPSSLPDDTERVNLGYNSIQQLGISDFARLQWLEMLMLHGNDITTISPGAFYNLRSLQILKLSYNKLKRLDPSMFQGLQGLVRLYLDHNAISFIEPFTFSGLMSLRLLQMEGNQLRELHPHTFITISVLGCFWGSSLRHLYLADNQLEHLQPGTLQHLDRLEVLSLHGNPWACDCHLHWLQDWNKKKEGVIKCKKERNSGPAENCAVCATPQHLNGSQIFHMSPEQLPCERPMLSSPLKLRDSTIWEDSESDFPYTKDLEPPLGHLTFMLSDSHGNQAHVSCVVSRPSDGSSVTWENLRILGQVVVNMTLVSQLECEIDRDELQKLWRLVAYYYESPAILERGPRQNNTTFQYSQTANEDSPYFTELKGQLMAEPEWLLQPRVTLQLNRRRTTTKKLVLNFSAFISKQIDVWEEKEASRQSWAMIQRAGPGRIQAVLEGSDARLECKVIGSGGEKIEWMLPDLSLLNSSHPRLMAYESGILVINKVTLSDSGLYHCLLRTDNDIDVVSFRLTVRELLLSPESMNGQVMSVESGKPLSLPCSVSSVQPMEIIWYLPRNQILKPLSPNGRTYVSSNGTLVISKASHEDAGEYSCLASNLYGADMLSHLVVITGDKDSEPRSGSGVVTEELPGGTPLKVVKPSMEDPENEGSGFQELKHSIPTRTPHRTSGWLHSSNRNLSQGNQGTKVKEAKRKLNKSVKELDPNRWAQILAKAYSKGQKVYPTTSVAFGKITPANRPTTVLATPTPTPTTTSTTAPHTTTVTITPFDYSEPKGLSTTSPIYHGSGVSNYSKPQLNVSSFTVSDTGRNQVSTPGLQLHTQIEQSLDKHLIKDRVKSNTNPLEGHRRRPPFRRRRPPHRRIQLINSIQNPSILSVSNSESTTSQQTSTNTKAQASPTLKNADKTGVNTELLAEAALPTGPTVIDGSKKQDEVPSHSFFFPITVELGPYQPQTPLPTVATWQRPLQPTSPNIMITPLLDHGLPIPQLPEKETGNKNTDNPVRPFEPDEHKAWITTTKNTPVQFNHSTNIKPPPEYIEFSIPSNKTTGPFFTEVVHSEGGEVHKKTLPPIITVQNSAQKHLTNEAKEIRQRLNSSSRDPAEENRNKDSFLRINGWKDDSSRSKSKSPHSPVVPVDHPWLRTKHTQKHVQIPNTQPPSTATFSLGHSNRFPIWPSIHISKHHPSSPHRSWHSKSAAVTNRPEITALTVKATALPFASPPALTPQPPLNSSVSRTRDHLLLTRLRNRYRQSQLDAYRLSQLGKTITPKPRTSSPTPKPHEAPKTQRNFAPVTPTPFPWEGNRQHSTASILYGSRWHYSHWGPRRLSTVLPFPHLMGSGTKPRITSTSAASVSALAEADVILPCKSQGQPEPVLSWTKVSTGATIQANTKHGQRFEVLSNGTFVIRNVQLQDRGQYLCTAQNKFGTDRMVVTLAVLTQAPKIMHPNSKDISVYLGRPITLDCVAVGKPQAQISWILPDRTFLRDVWHQNTGPPSLGSPSTAAVQLLSNGTLRIQAANFSSKGNYKCIASNAAGADTLTYHIHVAALPPAIKEEASESTVLQTGGNIYLHCTAKGEPLPTLKWSLPKGIQMKPSQVLGGRLFVFPNGTLYMRSTTPSDSGRYECSAANMVGMAKRVVLLDIVQEASSPQQHQVKAMYGSTVYLHCPESMKSPHGALWTLPSKTLLDSRYSPERPITVFSNGTLRIQQLTAKDGGNYRCMFQRPNGEDMELFQVEVLMKPPKIEHLGTASKKVVHGTNFQVDCVASGLPDPEVSWSLPDGTTISNALQSDDSGVRSRRYVIFGNGTLLLRQMVKADEGDYTCYAKNELGEDEMRVNVKVVQDSPRILSKNQVSVRGRLGESAYMKCDASGDLPPTIIWLSPSNNVIASSSNRYQILEDGTLVIRKVGVDDQGKYACVSRNSAGDDIKNVKLEVEAREPHIGGKGGKASMKVLAVSYQTKLLHCKADGMPEPRITWTTPQGISMPAPYHGGRFQVHQNGSLELRGLRKTDEGRFVCQAKNDLGEASLEMELEVASLAEKPSFAVPNIEVLPLKVDAHEITLECLARGKPMPEFVWLLPNGIVLNPGDRLERFLHHPSNGTLRILRPVTGDKGVYRCLAKNVAGQGEKRYSLEPGKKPQIRGTPGPMKISFGQSLHLTCLVDAWPQATITWTLPSGLTLNKPQVIGKVTYLSNGTLQVKDTAMFDRGTYSCKATNTFGSSVLSYPVAVMVYPPRITSAPPSITRVARGSPITLTCIATGTPKPEISWTLPGRTTLVPSNRFATQGSIHMTMEGNLVIQNPVLMNSGIYKCNAKNALGTDFKATYLQVI